MHVVSVLGGSGVEYDQDTPAMADTTETGDGSATTSDKGNST